MTQHLTLNTVIHAAVRRDVARFQQALATFPIGSRERAAQLEMAWQNLDHQLYHHHHGEETIFWPALRELGADESLVGDLGGEHERLAEAMTLTRKAMSALASEPSEVNVDQARAAFDTLGDVVDTHFTHEERDLEPMLAGVIASPQWKRAQARSARPRAQRPLVSCSPGCWTTLIRLHGRSYATRFRDLRCLCCPARLAAPTNGSPLFGNELSCAVSPGN
jgi:hypothetical protein